MEKYKQQLTDVLIVCILPIAIMLAYHYYFSTPTEDDALLSVDSASLGIATPGGAELGSKTKEILNTLSAISFDTTFFADPTFLSLQDLTPVYMSTGTGRPYPFTTPEDVEVLIERANQSALPSSFAPTSTKSSPSSKTTTKSSVK